MRLKLSAHARTATHTVLGACAVLVVAGFMAFAPGQAGKEARAAATVQGIAVPMYEYPTIGTFWDDITGAGGANVPFVIVNPNNGPGASVDANYTAEIAENETDGIRSIGYVYSSYQTRPFQEVYDDIDDFYQMYPGISGIFVDLVAEGDADDVCYVAALYNHVKNDHPDDLVVINPGTNISDAYEPYSDIFMNAENTFAALQSGWTVQYPGFEDNPVYTNRFWHVAHTTDASDYAAARDMLRANNAGWIYITDDIMPNPYKVTPSYWATELSDAAALGGIQTIPNRGKTQLPAGCRDLTTTAVNTTVTGTKMKTTNSAITVANNDSFAVEGRTRISFSMPSGVSMASASGTGWSCSTASKRCDYDGDIAASSSVLVNTSFAASCSYSSGSVTGSVTNFAGNTWTITLPLAKPTDCTTTSTSSGSSEGSSTGSTSNGTGSSSAAPAEEKTVTVAEPEPVDNDSNNPILNPEKNDTPTKEAGKADTVKKSSSFGPAKIAFSLVAIVLVAGGAAWGWVLYRKRKQPINWSSGQ